MAHARLCPISWSPLICILLLALLTLPRPTSQQEQPAVTPTTGDSPATSGTVCMSDCPTCPVICSQPPPSSFEEPQLPPPLLPQPPPPPAKGRHRAPPPKPYLSYFSPPPPPLLTLSPPGYEYASPLLGGLPGPPPPPFKFTNTPFSVPAPPNPMAPGHDYSYPYYYYYTSKATVYLCSNFLYLLFVSLMFLFW